VGILARAQVVQGQAAAATGVLTTLRSRFEELGETRFFPNIDALLCRIAMRQGDIAGINRWLREKAPKDDLRIWALYRYQYITKAMVQIANGDPGSALMLLARLLPYTRKCGRVMDEIQLHILMAICHYRMGNRHWKAEVCTALDFTWDYRFIFPIAQYGVAILPLLGGCGLEKDGAYFQRLLAATRVQAVNYPLFLKPEVKLAEPLTASEQQVLKLMCHNLSNQEICDILGIKLATVKTHVSHILQKLGVSHRGEAKTAAETLDLI
jgi:LuxR family maltose regulon positive regulatory protein